MCHLNRCGRYNVIYGMAEGICTMCPDGCGYYGMRLKDSGSISGVCQPITLYPCKDMDMTSAELVRNRLTVSRGGVAKFNGYYSDSCKRTPIGLLEYVTKFFLHLMSPR